MFQSGFISIREEQSSENIESSDNEKYVKLDEEIQKQDILNISQYSEHCEQQKFATKETTTTSKSEVKGEIKRNSNLLKGMINRKE